MRNAPEICHTDSFGGRTSVKVHVSSKPSPLARTASVLSALFVVPVSPLVGAILGSVAKNRIEEDASLSGKGRAVFAIRVGLASTVLQFLAVAGYMHSAWASIENAASLIESDAVLMGRAEVGRIDAEPAFGLHEFLPGSTRQFQVEVDGTVSNVRVKFDTAPRWAGAGFVFDSKVIGRPAALAHHVE
jgi:hypothetical protein